jgi:hypothetical protein
MEAVSKGDWPANQKPNGAAPNGKMRLMAILVEKKETKKAKLARRIQRQIFMMSPPDVARAPFIKTIN